MSTSIVSCYYRIKSKHSFEEYDQWITNFLTTVQTNLILFTSPDLEQYLFDKCSENLKSCIKIIVLPLQDLPVAQKYELIWDYQSSIDKDIKTGRTKECYILWNSKLWFLMHAIQVNPFKSDKFVWTDIGCLRTINSEIQQKLRKYPLYDQISNTQMDIVLLKPFQEFKLFFKNEVHFSGSIFAGHKDVIAKIHDLFYERLDLFIQQGLFIGCDQQTISSIFMTNYELFHPITIPPLQNIWIDPWFYLWQYFS